ANNTRPMAERAGRRAFCAASLARGIGRVGVGTQRYPVYIFRIAVPDRLSALRRGALEHPVPVDCHDARTGVIGQTDASDLAFGNVAARLLAVGKMAKCEEQSARKETEKAHPKIG